MNTTDVQTDSSLIRVGDCLVKEGFATPADIQKALKIQQKEIKLFRFSQETIFPPITSMSPEQRQTILKTPHIGLLCVQKGMITKETLYKLLKNKDDQETSGDVLMREGYLTSEILEELLLDNLGVEAFGELAVRLNFLKPADLKKRVQTERTPRTLGEILCELNVINPADLDYVLKKYSKQLKFGEVLVKQGILTQNQLMNALQEQFHRDEPLGHILLDRNLITVEQLYQALSTQYHIPFQRIARLDLSDAKRKKLTNIISAKYAQKNQILPISLDGNEMSIAVHNPEHIDGAQETRKVYGNLKISCVFITEDNFQRLFEEIYQASLTGVGQAQDTGVSVDALDISLGPELDVQSPRDKIEYGLTSMETQELVNYIIKYGISQQASDIHIEQDRKHPSLRYRIDGVLHTLQMKWLEDKLRELVNAIISRIKVASNMDIAERRLPQDGVFRVSYFDPNIAEQVDLDFRVATCPGISGENMTIRILDPRKAKVDINRLNHSQHVLSPLKQYLKSSAGMILVSGPTGSGKTSTLYSALQYVFDPSIKIITAEDPIEFSFPGIMQTQVQPKINLSFARLLRSFLRLDPDVILVGEIRDTETAHISFDAAQTGHLMLSTVHTNDSVGAITRLLDLEIDYNQMASSLMCVVAQRLLRRNCPQCTAPYTPPEEEWSVLFKDRPEHLSFYHGEGCPACNFTGFQGRTLISEILTVDPEIARALNRGASTREIKQIALRNGMKTMLDDGILKLETTTISELIRVVPNEMLKEFRNRFDEENFGEDGSCQC